MKVLAVNSSGRSSQHSVSRQLVDALIEKLGSHHRDLNVTYRNVAEGLPLVHESWIEAMYTPADRRTPEQNQLLAFSDELVDELDEQDVLILGAPMYNFNVSASLKAYIDLICRIGLTFKFSAETGLEGLLKGKKAYIVFTSGVVEAGSTQDLVTPYLKLVLAFIGITETEIIGAGSLKLLGNSPIKAALEAIDNIYETA
ncbi:FMN-dependent NADH-azoreductase [Hymenobacter volaticus]|uniref:FMN dependent NADH:quinone oxidoreductase n=1 Tax=Hymenobacter volaticus TaxID=2932254 RepID=A0ABY4GF29_9BACT|nr:NAD(P)H-dependent oxidoreductase [Hymenobacter volaticus]UOQ69452.1 NAD(P)H-dependent oxidoreductase [Hymenobacter volaticus]